MFKDHSEFPAYLEYTEAGLDLRNFEGYSIISRPVHKKGMGGHYTLKNALTLRSTTAKSSGMEAIASITYQASTDTWF